MKYAKYLLKIFFISYAAFALIGGNNALFYAVSLLLLISVTYVLKERFFDNIYLVAANFTVITASIAFDKSFAFMLLPTAFDFMNKKAYWGILPVVACLIYFLYGDRTFVFMLFLVAVFGLFGYAVRNAEDKEESQIKSLDEERRLRYELESAKARLLSSSKEIGRLAEVKERNRIAREIHDNIGHSITGILFQLQAARKLLDIDREKSAGMLDKAVEGLAGAVDMLRDTVHNIKPLDFIGIDYLEEIIRNYTYCPVDLRYSGDFNALPPGQTEIFCTIIKEALTNISKHSKATKAEVTLDINEKYTRLLIRDNGTGCKKINEGMGLSGIRERIKNVGGFLSISAEEGFIIVCLIPAGSERGDEIYENIGR